MVNKMQFIVDPPCENVLKPREEWLGTISLRVLTSLDVCMGSCLTCILRIRAKFHSFGVLLESKNVAVYFIYVVQ